MSKTITEAEDEIVEEFEWLGDWPEKYQHIIALGKSLPGLPTEQQVEENKVRGCQSNVWLVSRQEDGRIFFEGDSDALIVKGLVAIVLRVLSGHTPDEVLAAGTGFIDRIGLGGALSPTRNNGLAAMIKQIKYYALAYKAKNAGQQ